MKLVPGHFYRLTSRYNNRVFKTHDPGGYIELTISWGSSKDDGLFTLIICVLGPPRRMGYSKFEYYPVLNFTSPALVYLPVTSLSNSTYTVKNITKYFCPKPKRRKGQKMNSALAVGK